MKWIKYQVIQNIVDNGDVLINKKIGYSKENVVIAETEAYNGEYTIEEDAAEIVKEPLAIEFGGTGATTPEDAIMNFGAQARITCGTEEPTEGKDGDVYIQIIEE